MLTANLLNSCEFSYGEFSYGGISARISLPAEKHRSVITLAAQGDLPGP